MRRSVLALLAVALPLVAQAADLDTIFPRDEARCYARDFDAAYLEQHPKQKVTSMRIVRPRDAALQRLEAEEKENFNASGTNLTAVAFARIGVRVRKTGSKLWSGHFNCDQSRDGRKYCQSGECDGGGMMIEALANGGASVYFATYPIHSTLSDTEDFIEGPRAFAEKRKPVWKNRWTPPFP